MYYFLKLYRYTSSQRRIFTTVEWSSLLQKGLYNWLLRITPIVRLSEKSGFVSHYLKPKEQLA